MFNGNINSIRSFLADQTPAAPNIYSVTISGDPYVGETLTAEVGVTGYPTPSLTYQWKRDGVDISGATSSTYTAVEADDGTDLTVTVTATNSEGSDNATSAAVSISERPPLVAAGVESATEVGATVVYVTGLVATGVESASEVGSPSLDNTAPELSGVSFDGEDTITASLSEPATIYWLVDDNTTRTPAQVEAGGGEADGSFAVETGSNNDDIDVSGVSAGEHYLHIVAKDSGGAYSDVVSEEYTFPGLTLTPVGVESASEVGAPTIIIGFAATGVESATEVGSPTVYVTDLFATGVESTTEVGTAAFLSGVWDYSGSVVSNLPDAEGWEFTGSVVNTIPAAA